MQQKFHETASRSAIRDAVEASVTPDAIQAPARGPESGHRAGRMLPFEGHFDKEGSLRSLLWNA